MPIIEPPKAVLNADGSVNVASSPDATPAIQAAVDAQNLYANDTWATQRNASEPVVLAPGNYVIKPRDGGPTLAVWRGVKFDWGNANLHAPYPSSPTKSWCAIVAHSQANLTRGNLTAHGSPPDSAGVYDGIRVFQTDNGQWHNGQGTTSGFRGAGIRHVGAYVNYWSGGRVRYCDWGIIHEPMGQGEATFDHAYYAMPGVASGEVQGSTRRGTDLWIRDMNFDSLRKGGVIARGSASSTPGNLMLTDCLFEGVGGPAVFADKISTVQLSGVRMEEVGFNGPMVDIRHCWGSVDITRGHIDITGHREFTGPTGTRVKARPTAIYSVQWAEDLRIDPAYVYSEMPGLEYIVKPAGGTWRRHRLAPPALAGASRTAGWDPLRGSPGI